MFLKIEGTKINIKKILHNKLSFANTNIFLQPNKSVLRVERIAVYHAIRLCFVLSPCLRVFMMELSFSQHAAIVEGNRQPFCEAYQHVCTWTSGGTETIDKMCLCTNIYFKDTMYWNAWPTSHNWYRPPTLLFDQTRSNSLDNRVYDIHVISTITSPILFVLASVLKNKHTVLYQ